jgi:hypothetical protein
VGFWPRGAPSWAASSLVRTPGNRGAQDRHAPLRRPSHEGTVLRSVRWIGLSKIAHFSKAATAPFQKRPAAISKGATRDGKEPVPEKNRTRPPIEGDRLFKVDAKFVRLSPYRSATAPRCIAVDEQVEAVGNTECAADPKAGAFLRYIDDRAPDRREMRCNNDHRRLLGRTA